MGRENQIRVGVLNLATLGHISVGQNQQEAFRWLEAHDERFANVKLNYVQTGLPSNGSFWERLPTPGLIRSGLRGREEVGRLLDGNDVVVVNQQNLAGLCPDNLALGRVPIVLVSDITPRQFDGQSAYVQAAGNRLVEGAKYQLTAFNYRAAAGSVGWSEWTSESIRSDYGVPSERVHTISPGVNIEHWAVDRSRQTSNDRVRILFVGGDFERKGGADLLDVFQERFSSQARLDIVTRATDIPVSDNVFVYNGLENSSPRLRELYERADMFVLPTLGDANSIVSMEAAAAGLPVITTKVGGIPSTFNTEMAMLIDPGNREQLGEAIKRLMDKDRRVYMGERARETAVDQFDVRVNFARLLNLAIGFTGRSKESNQLTYSQVSEAI